VYWPTFQARPAQIWNSNSVSLLYIFSYITNAKFVVKEDEMGRACSTMGKEECIWDIGGKARRKETTEKAKT
jgi:hypothetical protein